MAKEVFEVGAQYEAADCGIDPIIVLRRTKKSIIVNNGTTTWRMVVRTDDNGNEYVKDSCVPKKWREAYTYSAKWKLNS